MVAQPGEKTAAHSVVQLAELAVDTRGAGLAVCSVEKTAADLAMQTAVITAE